MKLVDNNDDLESEDDIDSEPPEALPEDAVAEPDPEKTMPPPMNGTSPKSDDQAAIVRSSVDAFRGELVTVLRPLAGEAQSVTRVDSKDSKDDAVLNDPWPDIEWRERETRSSGTVRRWGRVVEEVDVDGNSVDNGFEIESMSKERSLRLKEEGNDLGLNDVGGLGREKVAEMQPKGEGERPLSMQRTKQRGVGSRERKAARFVALGVGVAGGELPPQGYKRDNKRRAPGSRGSKALTPSNGSKTKWYFPLNLVVS